MAAAIIILIVVCLMGWGRNLNLSLGSPELFPCPHSSGFFPLISSPGAHSPLNQGKGRLYLCQTPNLWCHVPKKVGSQGVGAHSLWPVIRELRSTGH